jgi:hypothetical protein
MKRISIFSWGFWGWGTATRKLVAAVDAVERQRGFGPPIFVDIRFRRAGRAPGFRGRAFENLLGRQCYRWMPTLGNSNVSTGKSMRIACPKAVDQLLDLAIDADEQSKRVIFFCACESPIASNCHRHKVADLLLVSARRRRVSVEVPEWPGGLPSARAISLRVSPETLLSVARGAKTVPLNRKRVPVELAGLPWGTLVVIKAGRRELPVAVGPAAYRRDYWVLPRFQERDAETPWDIPALRRQTARLRRIFRLDKIPVG